MSHRFGTYRGLLASTSALVLIASFSWSAAAQTAIEEITVTARKREESLQQIPLSITAITAAEIENRGVKDLRDVINLTPGLSMSTFGGGGLNFPVIRGMTNLTGGAFAENNVSVFYNGVYLLNTNMIDATFLDIERIEVVKGPVSALYGRNAYSGVINYVTKRPSKKFEGNAKVVAGTYDRYGVQGSVSGPVVDGKLGVRIAGRFDSFGGTWEDKVSGVEFGGYEKKAVQSAFEFDPSEALNILATAYYSDDRFSPPARALTSGNCGAAVGAFQPTICGKTPDFDSTTESRIRSTKPRFDIFGNDRHMFLGTGDVSINIGTVSLKSITSYMDGTRTENRDQDGTGIGYTYNLAGTPPGTVNLSTFLFTQDKDNSFTQEARLLSADDQRLRWSAGGFYSKFKRAAAITLTVDSLPLPTGRTAVVPFPIGLGNASNPPFVQRTRLSDEEVSGFGALDFDVTDRLTVAAEARRTKQKKFQNQTSGFLIFPSDPDGPNGVTGSWKFWSFRFTADYDLNDNSKLYMSAAKGNKAGGFNSSATIPADLKYNPESNWTYEAGLKSTLLGGKLVLDTSVFYSDLSGLQLFGFTTGGIGSVIRNGGKGKSYGLETNLSANVADGVSFGGGLAYADPTFKSGAFINSSGDVAICRNVSACTSRITTDVSGRTGLNISGFSFPRQSDWQATLSFDVVQPLNETWNWALRGNYRYESKQFSTSPQANIGFVGSKHIANLRLGVETDQYSISAFVDNLFNDGTPFNFGTGLNASNFQNPISVVYGDKRTFGVEAKMKF